MPAQSPCNIAGKSCFRSSRVDNFNKLPWPETKPTHTHTHAGPHNHRQTEIEIEMQPELPQQLDFGLCEGFSLAFA